MCGEIEDWQTATDVFVRLTTNGSPIQITLPVPYERVEEIRLNEVLAINFNGGASGMGYLAISGQGLTAGTVNTDRRAGVLVMIDVLNPHVFYSRPRVVARAAQSTLQQFEISFLSPVGAAMTFGELGLSLTIVCRKSEDEMAEVRRLKASIIQDAPSVKDGLAKTTYDPHNPIQQRFFGRK